MNVAYTSSDQQDKFPESERTPRPVMPAMMKGLFCRCPSCGRGQLFKGYLKSVHACDACSEEIHHHRADDAPPYFTITIVGHIIIPALLAVEVLYRPEPWVHLALWLPLTVILSLGMLRPIKGSLIGLQWALYMHGFDPEFTDDLPEPDPASSVQINSQGQA
ncbi:DUF983 domain-containing protein [Roseibium sp.]|uniref:DUF983 domain-containing protein n=1 Tax=Roseibium sp. TaxID=1936156 RepID=UPI003A96D9E8